MPRQRVTNIFFFFFFVFEKFDNSFNVAFPHIQNGKDVNEFKKKKVLVLEFNQASLIYIILYLLFTFAVTAKDHRSFVLETITFRQNLLADPNHQRSTRVSIPVSTKITFIRKKKHCRVE